MTKDSHNTDKGDGKPDKGKPKDRLALGISLGMMFGTAIGSINDNIELWLPMGVMFGTALGIIFSDDGN
jgi:hypothetical protein